MLCDLLKIFMLLAIFKLTNCVETIKFLNPDGEIVDSLLQVSEQDVHIEDFFWTGSGDGSYPPAYRRFPIIGSADGPPATNTIIRTATVLATVFVDHDGEQDDTTCIFDCEDQNGSPTEKLVPEDRRFWLMTVIAGVFEPDDFPILEDKLAKLYRIAFTRQQARHLGLTSNTSNPETPSAGDQTRKKRHIEDITKIAPTKTIKSNQQHKISLAKENIFINENTSSIRNEILRRRRKKAARKSVNKRETGSLNDKLKKDNFQILMANKNNKTTTNINMGVDIQKVDVFIHNMTLMGDEENSNLVENENVYDKRNSTASNQTEIIYSVFVAGKPVLATTASEDMQLLTHDEVNLVMEKLVYIKAEPYLKEPLATPLVPATVTGNSSLIAVFGKNTLLFIILCATIALLVILLLGLIFTAAAKRKRDDRMKRRITSTKTYMRGHSPTDDLATIKSADYGFDDDGMDNMGYEKEHEDILNVRQPTRNLPQKTPPVLHFPYPPNSRPTSSTSSTSDSSLYYPKRDTVPSVQRILNERQPKPYANIETVHQAADDALYSSVVKSKDSKKTGKTQKTKATRRKYLKNENRVGSIEQVEIHTDLSEVSTPTDGYERPLCLTTSIPYENNGDASTNQEIIVSHYHRNKVFNDHKFIENPPSVEANPIESPTEAINRKILKKLESQEMLSPDQGSIGSFLSMASVRSFPKCAVPESLSRVLEPTTVTHLDQLDFDADIDRPLQHRLKIPRYVEKEDDDPHLTRSHSDGADPGVVGPIVWQIHKESLEKQKESDSPLRDPVKTRTRFENLLDGAMKYYDDPPPTYEEDCITNDVPGAVKIKDYRVKTAAATIKSGQNTERPITAGAFPTRSIKDSLPPTPSKGAWGSGKQSPQVRPLSAGPFHTPAAPIIDVPRVLAVKSQLDERVILAAPLINAITDELKRFNENRQKE